MTRASQAASNQSQGSVPCAHCGLPAPQPSSVDENSFCCAGCRTVYALIQQNGWGEYYTLKTGEQEEAAATPGTHGYEEFDHPQFRETYGQPLAEDSDTGGEWRIPLAVPKIHCAACVWLVERVLRESGCQGRVDLGRQRVEVTWNPATHSLAPITSQLESLGYSSSPWRNEPGTRRREERWGWIRLAVTGACAGNVMFLAFALYAGLGEETANLAPLFRWASLAVSLPAVLWGGAVFYRGAWGAIRYRVPHIDLPITLAIIVAMLVSTYNVFQGSGEIYFDTLTTLIFLLLVGRHLQQRQQRRAAEASALLEMLTPQRAHRRQGESWVDVPVIALSEGDEVEVRPGEAAPADGIVTSGHSVVNKSLLTGESKPVEKANG